MFFSLPYVIFYLLRYFRSANLCSIFHISKFFNVQLRKIGVSSAGNDFDFDENTLGGGRVQPRPSVRDRGSVKAVA